MRGKWNRKIGYVTLVFFIIFMLGINVCAAGERAFLLDYDVSSEGLQLLLAAPSDGKSYEKNGFDISLSGNPVSVTEMKTIGESGMPVTIYCLVDVSGSMSEKQMTWMKQTLTEICGQMRDGDNLVIGTLGNTTEISGFLEDKEAILSAIDELAVTGEDTNLYAGIVESLDTLKTDARVHPQKCLLILSDGQDDQKSGITQGEAENAITEFDIPVYTVAVLPKEASGEAVEYGKLLGSFARMSTGGVHYAPDLTEDAASETANEIVSSMENSTVLYLDVSNIDIDKDIMLLRVTYTAGDGSSYEDTINVYGEDLAGMVVSDTEETTGNDTEEDVSTEEPGVQDEASDSQKSPVIYVIVLIVLVTAAVVIVVVIRKKKNSSEQPEEVLVEETEETVFQAVEKKTVPVRQTVTEDKVNVKTRTVRLLAIGYENIQKTLELPEGKEITIGRTNQADFVLRAEDNRLSNIHCKIKWEGNKLYICDAGSTNGTFVNGVPIKQMGRVVVHESDTIRVGSYEYRIG